MTLIELSAALGDDSPRDDAFWPRIGRVHIASSGPRVAESIRLAARHGVAVGVHLSIPDQGTDLRDSLAAQIETVREAAVVSHVRLRSTLHEDTGNDPAMGQLLVELIVELIVAMDSTISVVAPDLSSLASSARARGLNVIREAHADRRYGPDGLPQRASLSGSLLSPAEAVLQATLLARYGVVVAANGILLPTQFDTLCVDAGDESAVERLQAIETAVALRLV
jgi:5-oxoprolinase (ATP-hydrolysing) subunit A